MSAFDLQTSLDRFEARPGRRESGRRRSDAGSLRLSPEIRGIMARLLGGQERPNLQQLHAAMAARCRRTGGKAPSRATLYQFMRRARTTERRVGDLPAPVRQALVHFEDDSLVPEAQVAFHCFNHGDVAAMSFGAGLPWLALWQAARMRGWRLRSRATLEAVLVLRRI